MAFKVHLTNMCNMFQSKTGFVRRKKTNSSIRNNGNTVFKTCKLTLISYTTVQKFGVSMTFKEKLNVEFKEMYTCLKNKFMYTSLKKCILLFSEDILN